MFKLLPGTRRRSEAGASAVEYGLLVAGIAALVALVAFAFGGVVNTSFHSGCDKLKTGAGPAATC